jgi:hypothetical protein
MQDGSARASILPPLRRRQISDRLIIGIVLLPQVFVWFLLRRGYSAKLRIAAFLYALGPPAILIYRMFAT